MNYTGDCIILYRKIVILYWLTYSATQLKQRLFGLVEDYEVCYLNLKFKRKRINESACLIIFYYFVRISNFFLEKDKNLALKFYFIFVKILTYDFLRSSYLATWSF
jgi:hypothetical protein